MMEGGNALFSFEPVIYGRGGKIKIAQGLQKTPNNLAPPPIDNGREFDILKRVIF